jgi:hypothetical protein
MTKALPATRFWTRVAPEVGVGVPAAGGTRSCVERLATGGMWLTARRPFTDGYQSPGVHPTFPPASLPHKQLIGGNKCC